MTWLCPHCPPCPHCGSEEVAQRDINLWICYRCRKTYLKDTEDQDASP